MLQSHVHRGRPNRPNDVFTSSRPMEAALLHAQGGGCGTGAGAGAAGALPTCGGDDAAPGRRLQLRNHLPAAAAQVTSADPFTSSGGNANGRRRLDRKTPVYTSGFLCAHVCSDAAAAVKYIEDTLDDVEMGSPRRAGAFRTAALQVGRSVFGLRDLGS